MEKAQNLKEWRKAKGLTQEEFAVKLGTVQTTYQQWEAGRVSVPAAAREKLRKLGYQGPWPREEAKEAAAPAGGPYVTEKDFAEWRGYWRAGTEGVLERLATVEKTVADLVRRLDRLEGSR